MDQVTYCKRCGVVPVDGNMYCAGCVRDFEQWLFEDCYCDKCVEQITIALAQVWDIDTAADATAVMSQENYLVGQGLY